MAASSLVMGGLAALQWTFSRRALGLVMAFGAGVLISAVAYDIVLDAYETSAGAGGVGFGLAAGALTFYAGDAYLDRQGGADRKRSGRAGDAPARIIGLWVVVALVSGLAALAGYAVFDTASPQVLAFVTAFAGGAVLTMLADTMMPEAYEHGGPTVGLMTTLGFGLAFGLTQLE